MGLKGLFGNGGIWGPQGLTGPTFNVTLLMNNLTSFGLKNLFIWVGLLVKSLHMSALLFQAEFVFERSGPCFKILPVESTGRCHCLQFCLVVLLSAESFWGTLRKNTIHL